MIYKEKAYRFLGFDGLFKTIETEKLRLTNPTLFNDPLDSSSYLVPFDWEKCNDVSSSILLEKVNTKILFQSMYIASFSKEYKSEKSYLMWGHYGHLHKGVCFEIDFSNEKCICKPDQVIYPLNLVLKRDKFKKQFGNDLNNLSMSSKKKLGVFLLTNKNKIWKYEKEVRIIIDTLYLENRKDIVIDSIENEKYLYMKFDLNLISKVIFGINADFSDERKTIELFSKKGVFPLYEKMYINPVNLKLESQAYKGREI